MGTCQPQLQRPAALLKVVQLRAEVEGTLWGEEAEPPAMGWGTPSPHPCQQLTFRSWARSLSTSSGRSGCATVNAGTPGWEGQGCLVTWGCSKTRGNTPQKHKRREKTRFPYLKNAPLLPGNLLHGVPQDAGVVDAQGGDPTHHRRPGNAAWQCPCCPPCAVGTSGPGSPGDRLSHDSSYLMMLVQS